MPELPEVETVRKGLQKHVINKEISQIDLGWPGAIKTNVDKFVKIVLNNKIKKIDRVGKLLIFEFSKGSDFLLVHLKMTGQLIYVSSKEVVAGGHKLTDADLCVPNKYTWVTFSFANCSKLYFNDMRKFGYLKLSSQKEKEKIISQFGPEPLQPQFTLKKFEQILKNRKTNIKTILLNQKLIAGIGNIYADEICFLAKVRPDRKINDLTKKEVKKIHQACKNVLRKAIKSGGTTFRDFTDTKGRRGNFSDQLKVYNRRKQKCLICKKSIIKKLKVAGRGTHFCSHCQK